jgi:hypothetical protein
MGQTPMCKMLTSMKMLVEAFPSFVLQKYGLSDTFTSMEMGDIVASSAGRLVQFMFP